MFGAALFVALGMAACGGGNGTTKTTTPGVSGVHSAYVANTTGGSISEYAIDDKGVLHEITGSPFALTNGNPVQLVMTPNGKFLYAADPAKNTIFEMSINADTGVLTSVGTQTSGTTPSSMVIDPGSKFLYVGNAGASNISVYAIGTDGKLTETAFSPVAVNGAVRSVTVSAKGTYLFAAVPSTGSIYQFSLNTTTGQPTVMAGSPYAIGNSPVYVGVAPDETFAIVADDNSLLNRLNIGSGGALTLAANSPFISGTKPIQVIIDSTSTYIYLLNQGSSTVTVLTYTAGSPHQTGAGGGGVNPAAMALYNSDLYITNTDDNTVSEFSSSSGVLSVITPLTLPTGAKPHGIAVR